MTHADRDADDALRLHLLVLRCQAGDDRAFARLMDTFGARTLRYLRGLIGDAADDVQQDVWLAVYRGLSRLSNPGAFRTWLFRTTRHRAIDHLRAQRREQELFTDATDLDAIPDDAGRPLPDAPGLDGAIARLAPLQREALLLRFRDEMTYAEIALVAGCSVGTVRSRLFYAKRRLHELLAHEDDTRRTAGAPFTRGAP